MRLSGSICALVTPFDQAERVDERAFLALLDMHLAAGTDGVVVGGSTGESGALDEEELARLIELAAERCSGHRMQVIAGAGAASTHKAARLVELGKRSGAAAALVVTPFYARPTQEGLYRHYGVLSERGLPLISYNVPTRTGCDLLPATLARLAEARLIVAHKEAVADPERVREVIAACGDVVDALSGDDETALRSVRAGARGVISVVNNVVPRAFKRMLVAAGSAAGDTLDQGLRPLYAASGVEPNPIPVKWMLARMGMIQNVLRLPLLPLSTDACERVGLALEGALGLS